ncbi:PA2778 family cysteine peptidase [Ramlibacter sp. WS9]|uniref:PA2778 family cysteine peptidase n=1 Tax=Ramlibacter sp. WS9 TaxID=1882741 RepID=UPI0011443D91|nr:PA2778 family cysteine peptidase [Ramlibacter sp. WS9]ROZ69718.1 bacteriocin-processing peptidase family protein [Ramlibacter sp. WS9]
MTGAVRTARLAAGFLCCWLIAGLMGCAQLVPQTIGLRTGWPEGVPQHVELKDVPFFPQTDYQCGPAALATILSYSGAPVTPDALVNQVYLPARKGSLQLEMLSTPRRYGRVSYALAPRYADMLREVAAGNPVVVLQDIGPMFTQWHYAVLAGFDYPSGTLFLRSGTKARQEMPFTAFEREWMKSGYWAMVVTPPDRIPVTATEEGWMAAVLAMVRSGDGDSAAKAYEAALTRWPDNLPAAIGLANQYHTKGALAEAGNVLRKALLRHPKSIIVMNNLAQTLSDQGRHAEALAQIDKAADPASPFAGEVKNTRQLILQRIAQRKTGSR